MQAQCGSYKMGALTLTIRQCSRSYAGGSCRARLATVILFQLPVTLRLTTLFHTSYCLPPVSVACYIPLLPGPTSCIYRGLSAIQNKQSPHPFLSGSTRALSSRGRPPWTPPAHCVLYSLRGQSSCRGFGRAFGRAFAEPRMEVRVEIL